MTRKTPDEIRLDGLKLLAKMIVSVYLKQVYQVPDSDLTTGEIEASHSCKRHAGFGKVAQTGQDKAGVKKRVDPGADYL
jgi:hypothetical protein